MYYTTIPLVSERPHNKRWDASKLRELRKRLDSGTMTTEEIDQVAADFMDGEIVDLASDWLGNTVCSFLVVVVVNFDTYLVGRSKTLREMFYCSKVCNVGTHFATSGDNRYPQEWNLGCSEDY
jgi:hypothetical protein